MGCVLKYCPTSAPLKRFGETSARPPMLYTRHASLLSAAMVRNFSIYIWTNLEEGMGRAVVNSQPGIAWYDCDLKHLPRRRLRAPSVSLCRRIQFSEYVLATGALRLRWLSNMCCCRCSVVQITEVYRTSSCVDIVQTHPSRLFHRAAV